MKMNNHSSRLIMKSLRGKVHSIRIQIHSRISFREDTSGMTFCRIWAWVIALTVSSWVAKLKMSLKIWILRACSLRVQRIWMRLEPLTSYRHGKYNINHRPRLSLFLKCLLHFIRFLRAVCTSSQRWQTLRLLWWISWISCHFLPCKKPLPRCRTMVPWVRELSSLMQAAPLEDIWCRAWVVRWTTTSIRPHMARIKVDHNISLKVNIKQTTACRVRARISSFPFEKWINIHS